MNLLSPYPDPRPYDHPGKRRRDRNRQRENPASAAVAEATRSLLIEHTNHKSTATSTISTGISVDMQPPVSYPDFAANFSGGESLFDTNTPFTLPDLPSDSNLLSSAESNSFFGFLDKFEWEFDPVLPHGMPMFSPTSSGSDTAAPSSGYSPPPNAQPLRAKVPQEQPNHPPPHSSASSSSSSPPRSDPPHHNHTTRTKPLLSTPQKRLNHIMSEQKRRNAIRDGYATLTNLLAPAGAPVGSGIPTRGRPKGSGTRGKKGSGGAKGKSGVLFRAVEYCKWLEEGCDALRKEVERIEVAAGFGGEVL